MQDQQSNSKLNPSSGGGSGERLGPMEASTRELPSVRPRSRLIERADAKQEAQRIRLRTRQLTFSLLTFVGAISSLSPFLSLHLTNQIGFLLFESELLQLRASLITVIVCLTALVILGVIIIITSKTCPPFQSLDTTSGRIDQEARRALRRRSLLLQRVLKRSAGTLATISIFFYFSLALLTQNIHQTQRLPFATFDCNANLIIIENCQQQFPTSSRASHSGQDVAWILFDALPQLFGGDLNGNNERLANKLECLKYNDETLHRLRAPTRFLLSNCGLVCKSHRQQLHQFGDDLNSDLSEASQQVSSDEEPAGARRTAQLIAPYSQPDYQEVNATRLAQDDSGARDHPDYNQDTNHMVSLKLCFSGELDGTNSNYKRFCIENLTGGGRVTQTDVGSPPASRAHRERTDQTLTVGQLNAILSKVQIERAAPSDRQQFDLHESASISAANSKSSSSFSAHLDQSTHYVNPIVQFESHFKNWPHLTRASISAGDQRLGSNFYDDKQFQATNVRPHADWCRFKPIPPFIVNNKPFSDIHCSLESDYQMSTSNLSPTRMSQRYRRQSRASTPRIYLKKSMASSGGFESAGGDHRERCNIQCKVNILYQVLAKTSINQEGKQSNSYYLPMKYCLIVSSYDDKQRASSSYMIFRSLADASLLLAFILIDAQLLIESKDTKQFQLEGKKVRLIGLLLALLLPPLLAGLLFDLTAAFLQRSTNADRDNLWLVRWCNEHLLPWLSSLWYRLGVRYKPDQAISGRSLSNATDFVSQSSSRVRQELVVDKYLVPFLVYAILMFAFALSTFKTTLVFFVSPLVGMASTEELGLAESQNDEPQATIKREKKNPTKIKPATPDNLRGRMSSLRRSLNSLNSEVSTGKNQTEILQKPSGRRNLVNFALLTLFLGLQFNLSQLTQSQILFDSFNIQNDLILQQQAKASNNPEQASANVAIWIVLISSSSGAFAMLLIALVFSNELSHFLNEFYPFKRPAKANNQSSRSHNSAKFNKFLASSLVIYSLRYFVLANISPQATRLKWPLVILFQATELLNFPLTWFVLTSRAHELLTDWNQHQSGKQCTRDEAKTEEETRADIQLSRTSSHMSSHLVIQAVMAFVYFALARFMALFTHSLHASLYLHSDNIDWFIDRRHNQHSFGNRTAPIQPTEPSSDHLGKPIESLFVPLPSERQTYLHASRLFVKYNSFVCLIVGLFLGGLFVTHKLQVYLENRRLERATRRSKAALPSDQDSDLIDERLSIDLAEIHSGREAQRHNSAPTLTRYIPKSIHQQTDLTTDESGASAGLARAQVHFRYGFGRPTRRPSSSSTSSGSYSLDAAYRSPQDQHHQEAQQHDSEQSGSREAWRRMSQADNRFGQSRVKQLDPIAESDRSRREEPNEQTRSDGESFEEEIKQITRRRSIRIVEDDEVWPDDDDSVEEEVKQISMRKSIRLVEDDEVWPDDEEEEANSRTRAMDSIEHRPESISPGEAQRVLELSMAISPPPVEFADNYELYMPPPEEFNERQRDDPQRFRSSGMQRASSGSRFVPVTSERQRKRQITFSPTTTFIDQDGEQSTRVQDESGSDQSVQ